MAEPKPATPAMGDIIGKTRQRLETNDDPTARLKSLSRVYTAGRCRGRPHPNPGTAPANAPASYFRRSKPKPPQLAQNQCAGQRGPNISLCACRGPSVTD